VQPDEVADAFAALGIAPPNLFLVGAVKAGTTSLWGHLSAHPDVFMTTPKESHFFSVRNYPTAIREPRRYAELFAGATSERYRGEASATYLHDPEAAARIHAAFGRPAVLVCLRDPVERAYADYLMTFRYGRTRRPFAELVREELENPPGPDRDADRFVLQGFYAEQLERWLGLYGDAVHVVFSEEVFADAPAGMRAIFERLGLDPAAASVRDDAPRFPYAQPRGWAVAAVYRRPRLRRLAKRLLPGPARAVAERALLTRAKPPVDPETRRLLRRAFRPHDQRLRELLGRSLPWDGRD
jgi:hypothetical protein